MGRRLDGWMDAQSQTRCPGKEGACRELTFHFISYLLMAYCVPGM